MNYMKSFLKKEARQIYLYQVKDSEDRDCYFYIFVKKSKLEEVKKITPDKVINLSEYGNIIESGFGKPSEEIRKKMKEEYNYSDD